MKAASFKSNLSAETFEELEDTFDFEDTQQKPEKDAYVWWNSKIKRTSTTLQEYLLTEKDTEGDYEVSYLRKTKNCFVYPTVPDLAVVKEKDIKRMLPTISGQTKRLNAFINFGLSFDNVDIR
ncbi:hypothetical protein QE152_g25254 [Popillia japonica]|uniref:Uncharacterized protein n=1 Tax=Popillia japonica TaxID=7064 RepID=A0AAW1K2M5_POPJA